tara:strand:- start:432 stop:734 length:303 start_codon:yes stop_codon:yes gene_type:complete
MNIQHFKIYEATFNYLGNILLDEYKKNKSSDTLAKIKCINQMYMYTNTLQIDYNILHNKYKNITHEHNLELQTLNKQLDEANNTIRLGNLGSTRFGKKDV